MLKRKILVVDDEEAMGKMVKFGLESMGPFEIQYESDGTRVLEAVRRFRPDLILMDIIMTPLDGSKLASDIKSDPLFRDTPIIFFTGTVTSHEIDDRGGSIGGQDFIAKPIELKTLFERVQKYLQ